ncbi:MAG: hypothetical protein ACJ72Z_05655 [Pyrinomonadaceae bacterium]
MNRERSAMIDNYLLGKLGNTEIESLEQSFLTDDELYYEVAERENELVDKYVGGKLDKETAAALRNSLSRVPARRKKLDNAILLKRYVDEVRTIVPQAEERIPWYERLGFAFRAPAFAAAALGLVLAGMVGLLLVQNRNLNTQIARLNAEGNSISELRQREAELQAMLESERAAGSDLTTDLESERERRTALESELSELQKKIAVTKPPSDESPIVPTIATLILRPTGIRGGPAGVRTLRLENEEKRVALKIILPNAISEGTISVRLNDSPVAADLKPNNEPGGQRSVSVSVAATAFRNGMNRVEIFDSNAKNIYSFAVLFERR